MDVWRTLDDLLAASARLEALMPGYECPAAYAVGVATISPRGAVLDTWFPHVNTDAHLLAAAVLATVCGYRNSTRTFELSMEQLAQAIELLTPAGACAEVDHPNLGTWRALLSSMTAPEVNSSARRIVATFIAHFGDALADSHDAYLRLHLLSHRLIRPHGANLDGIFAVLPTVVWTDDGAHAVEEFAEEQLVLSRTHRRLHALGVDKFPPMLDYVVPSGVRIADASRVRLGAHLAEGTVVMHEGFCNFNAGTLGPAMIEGRISSGVVVGPESDLGGGASVMGTLSGGGKETITIGSGCLVGANAGIGVSLGDNCVVEAGLYVTAGSRVRLADGTAVKARELSGRPNLLYRRNSLTGAIEAVDRQPTPVGLNPDLHS